MPRRTTAAALLAAGALTVATSAATAAPAGATTRWIVRDTGGSAAAAAHVVAAGGTVVADLPLVGGVAADLRPLAASALAATAGTELTPDQALRTAGIDDAAPQLSALDLGPLAAPDAGAGVGVALIDTGVDPLPPLAGHLVAGPDFSGERSPLDGYGHGTFMAGLIAGAGTGSAPGATVVSVKVAAADGSTDVVRVISGISWALANRERLGIRVMSLSLSAPTTLAPGDDPIDLAVDAARRAGLTVVAAAGNTAGQVTAPGDDPGAITVGAEGSAPGVPADWSASSATKPDVLAPGTSVVSLRAPGSTIDRAHPAARIGDHLFRGSGTSMATALVAGGVADLLAAHPSAGPSDVAAALVAASGGTPGPQAAAADVAGADARLAGTDRGRAHRAADPVEGALPAGSWQPADWAAMRWAGSDWAAMRWASDGFAAMRWAGDDWAAMRWAGSDWNAMRWASADVAAMRWSGADFAAMRWSGADFAAMRWSGADWSAMRWSGADWSAMRWSSESWSDRAWG